MVSRLPSVYALAAACALAAGPASAGAQALAVPTTVAGSASTGAAFEIEGTLQALQQSTVAAQVGGTVRQRVVKAGDRVKAGAVLARIDEREAQAGLAGAEAAVAQAQASLTQAQQGATRTRELRVQGFVSQAALDTAESQLAAAQAALRQAQAGRAQAVLARSFVNATAPFDALVLATHVEAGDLATPGRPLVTLYAPGGLRAVIQVPLSRTATARAATVTEVTLPGGRRVAPSTRTELPGTDAVSQTVEWRLELPPAATAGLAPGQSVQVRFAAPPAAVPAAEAASAAARLVVPLSTVLTRGELTAVYVAQGERFLLKAVRLGARHGDAVEVMAGLKAGERIATDPVRAGLAGATPAAR